MWGRGGRYPAAPLHFPSEQDRSQLCGMQYADSWLYELLDGVAVPADRGRGFCAAQAI